MLLQPRLLPGDAVDPVGREIGRERDVVLLLQARVEEEGREDASTHFTRCLAETSRQAERF